MDKYKSHILLHKLPLISAELRQAMTHSSFYKTEDNKNDNSRLIFLGNYAVRGVAAKFLYSFVQGTGTQLQHFLGNLFNVTNLTAYYEEKFLGVLVRADERFDRRSHRHIFAQAYLGLLFEKMEEKSFERKLKNEWIFRYWHLLPKQFHHDIIAQTQLIALQKKGGKLKLELEKGEDKAIKATLLLKGKTFLSVESDSEKYIRKKVYKKALIQLIEDEPQSAGVV